MDIQATLARLSLCNGPSGCEGEPLDTAKELLSPLVDAVWTDRFGNLIGLRRCGREGARRVVLDAHLDEVGLLITGAEEGFLRFRAVGGVDPRMLPDREITILTEPPAFGVVAVLPPHVQKEGDADRSLPIADLRIDAGLTQEQAEALVGTFAVPRGRFRHHLGDVVSGKALDDRAGFVTLLRTAELLRDAPLDVDLYLMGSSREETGGGGAVTGAFALAPDCFVAVDVTFAHTPDCPRDETFPAGGGPTIGLGPNIARWMARRLIEKAEVEAIDWTPEVMTGHSGTNAWGVQTAREGIATAVVSIPLKYMHSPVETLDLRDVEQTAQLLAAFVRDLGTLCALSGVSSWEDEVRDYFRAQAAPYADRIRTDAMGCLIVEKRGARRGAKRLMLAAHMDEVGLIVRSIGDDGYLRFGTVGGIDRRVLVGKRVLVGPQKVPGIIGLKAYHLLDRGEEERVPKLRDLTIDIGARDAAQARAVVAPGDVAVFDSDCVLFGNGLLKAKAIDDRVGCAVMLELLREELPMDCTFAFTVQEEVGTRGAFGAAFSVVPDIALVLEGTTAADLPGTPAHQRVCAPGKGPVVPYMDGGTVYDRGLFELLRDLAEGHGIPWQTKEYISGGTDAAAIQRSREGVRVAAISAAVRYLHAPASVASLADCDHMLDLARLFIQAVAGME